jgi:hypothetical protein
MAAPAWIAATLPVGKGRRPTSALSRVMGHCCCCEGAPADEEVVVVLLLRGASSSYRNTRMSTYLTSKGEEGKRVLPRMTYLINCETLVLTYPT